MDDLADGLEFMSHQDEITSQVTYSYANQMEIYQMAELSGLICAQGVAETNLHCLEAR
eukprot:CAMPEP_0185575556 /NCGR_PEP_ID=MMETSP0434-20130131/6712_1 /TAXON_ID=626734 ORGANISM="Favella taraikaensis, Strain Fe Narragansett Bay" /NCGR_SAMPLE_ID=MMETSP0434 /ASSEMBLY_ACC=CAM_ASM_000379 /LENGTH=57 /DNA_ID=CAMNT_0028192465 /DNA_START=1897 /DNA_END=2070 /DNA_ORIENTATION=+